MEKAAVAYLEELFRQDLSGTVFIEVRLLLFLYGIIRLNARRDMSVRHLMTGVRSEWLGQLMSSKQD